MAPDRGLGHAACPESQRPVRREHDQIGPFSDLQRCLGQECRECVENYEARRREAERRARLGDVAEYGPFLDDGLVRAFAHVRLRTHLRSRQRSPPEGRRDV